VKGRLRRAAIRRKISVQETITTFAMKPFKSILDRSFIYVPSAATSVDRTWRRYGWRPVHEEGSPDELQADSAQSPSEPRPVPVAA
jgi:hypothetical protein